MKRYETVLFDMDGVIVDSMNHHAESWIRVFREFCGLDLSKEDIFRREGMSGLSSIIDILEEKRAPVPDDEVLLRLREKKLDYLEKSHIDIFPGVEEMLLYLHSRKVKLGLVTGSLLRSVSHLLPRSLLELFGAVITTDDITNGKPHPEPYLKGMEVLGSVKEETLAVENAPMGVLSAKNAGVDCFAIETTLPEAYLKKADRIFKDHRDLLSFFKETYD